MTIEEKTVAISADGIHKLTVTKLDNGLYYFSEYLLTWEEATEYSDAISYFMPSHVSGLYDSAEAAEADARVTLTWL